MPTWGHNSPIPNETLSPAPFGHRGNQHTTASILKSSAEVNKRHTDTHIRTGYTSFGWVRFQSTLVGMSV